MGARIRTIKPEFWEDEIIGLLSRDARLLFIATLNLADDEGLLRWSPAYLKSAVFMYDDDLPVERAEALMAELVKHHLILPYLGGRAQQRLAWIINFRRHQNINRPTPSRLPAPSLQRADVRLAYGRRDRWTCHICHRVIPETYHEHESLNLSVDHLIPVSKGGSDYPTNIKAAHAACNKSRCDREIGEITPPRSVEDLPISPYSVSDSVRDSVSESMSASPMEGNGREGKGRERKGARENSRAPRDPGEVREFWRAEGLVGDPDSFFEWHSDRGWKWKSWKGAAKNWSRREAARGGPAPVAAPRKTDEAWAAEVEAKNREVAGRGAA